MTKTEDQGNARIKALAKECLCAETSIRKSDYGDNYFMIGDREYLILTEDEMKVMLEARIRDSVWAFQAEFIMEQCDLGGYDNWSSGRDSLQRAQELSCEEINEFLVAVVEKTCGMDAFIEAAVDTDGRGHFMAAYDGMESIEDDFYIYRNA